jgi:hypothetical protein
MGELIAFKPAGNGVCASKASAAPVGIAAEIVVFTGVWRERPADVKSPAKRVRRMSGKRSKISEGGLESPRA